MVAVVKGFVLALVLVLSLVLSPSVSAGEVHARFSYVADNVGIAHTTMSNVLNEHPCYRPLMEDAIVGPPAPGTQGSPASQGRMMQTSGCFCPIEGSHPDSSWAAVSWQPGKKTHWEITLRDLLVPNAKYLVCFYLGGWSIWADAEHVVSGDSTVTFDIEAHKVELWIFNAFYYEGYRLAATQGTVDISAW